MVLLLLLLLFTLLLFYYYLLLLLAVELGRIFCSMAFLSSPNNLFTSDCGKCLATPANPWNNFVASLPSWVLSIVISSLCHASSLLLLLIVYSSGLYGFFSCTSNHSVTNPSLLFSFEPGFFQV